MARPCTQHRARFLRATLAAAAFATAAAVPVAALPKSHVRASLVAERQWIEPGKPITVGLRLRMEDGWHTYWTNPGDAGLPPKVSWRLPEGFAAGPISWPAPRRIAAPPLMSYGYEGEVVLPMVLETPGGLAPGSDVRLAGRADWVECKEVCLPGRSEVEIVLGVRGEPAPASAEGPLFDMARRAQPVEAAGWGLEGATADGKILLWFHPPDGAPTDEAYFFSAEAETVEHGAPQVLHAGRARHRLDVVTASKRTEPPARLRGVLSVQGRFLSVDLPVSALAALPAPPVPAPRLGPGLPVALAFAFLGGLILNLMPCVLPVLSLKVLGFVRQAGEDRARTRLHGLVFTAGVLASFWALLGVLLLLRGLGQQVGWGFQLQSPAFVVFLAFLFFLLGLNLFGVFEVGASLAAAGNVTVGRSGLAASFGNGVLATVVATPCTAPFMGSALGYGLGQTAAVSTLVFTTLGLGMAAPYLLLSLEPRLLRYLPRPGAWMEGFKQLMGFLLMATVVALLWLFGQQRGVDGMTLLLGALLLAGLGAWLYGRPAATPRGRAVRLGLSAALVAAGLAVAFGPARAAGTDRPRGGAAEGRWEEWSEARVAELRAQGRPVFVDFTAAWCLTCKVNEKVALEDREVQARFEREGVTLLKADWTLRDDRITRALAGYGRQGVPAYVLYGREPGGEPHVLPELLTPGVVFAALDRVLGPRSAEAR